MALRCFQPVPLEKLQGVKLKPGTLRNKNHAVRMLIEAVLRISRGAKRGAGFGDGGGVSPACDQPN